MRTLFTLLIILRLSVSSYSQEISNSSFESWIYESFGACPTGWTSSNDFSVPIGPAGVFADSASYDGMLAARIITTNIGFTGAPYAGFIVNGKMNVTGHYDVDSIFKAGEPFTYKPDALIGQYKYSSDAFIEDWGHAFVLLKKYNTETGTIDTVGFGSNTLLNPSENYRQFQVPITYTNPELTPDSIVVAFFSTYPTAPISGGKLWIDDLSFGFTTSINSDILDETHTIYPNPASTMITVGGEVPDRLTIYNVNGHLIKSIIQKNQIDISDLSGGVYILAAEINGKVISKRFIKL